MQSNHTNPTKTVRHLNKIIDNVFLYHLLSFTDSKDIEKTGKLYYKTIKKLNKA